jgi:uncharacterized membrane protein (DUF485 family)
LSQGAKNVRLAVALGVAAIVVYIVYVLMHAMNAP